MISTIKKFLKKIMHKKKNTFLLSCIVVFVSFLSLFPAGICHSSTTTERSANYLANVATNHTINKKYLGLMVEPKDEAISTIRDPVTEFLDLYGVFRERYATYVSTYNAKKDHTIFIDEIDLGINYSFFNIDRGYGAEKYKDTDHYKTITYPLELMFESSHPYIPGKSFIYISQSSADYLLDKYGKEHTKENYRSLIYSDLTIRFDGNRHDYYIDNIYLETNYFYEALNETIGNFLVGGYPKDVSKKQALFFLRNQTYQNIFFLDYVATNYPASHFDYTILEHNLVNNYKIEASKVTISPDTRLNSLPIIILSISILLMVSILTLLFLGNFDFSIKETLLIFSCAAIPYLIFKILFVILNDSIVFSHFSTASYMWCLLAFAIIYVLLGIFKKYIRKRCC